VEQVERNLKAAQVNLTPDALAALDAIFAPGQGDLELED
jgi:aryl-alcohol dehydrogenase-like predicted oxidoreductase